MGGLCTIQMIIELFRLDLTANIGKGNAWCGYPVCKSKVSVSGPIYMVSVCV